MKEEIKTAEEKAADRSRVTDIKNLMKKLGLDAKAAMEALNIYFASTSKNVSNMCENGQYVTTDKVYYVPVDSATKNSEDPTVKVTMDQEFLYTLWKKGVLSNNTKDEDIKIFPKYAQRTKKVRFFNTDRPEDNTKYDKDNRYSELINVVEAYEKYEAASDSEKKGLVKVTKNVVNKPVLRATGIIAGKPYVTDQDEAEYAAELHKYRASCSEPARGDQAPDRDKRRSLRGWRRRHRRYRPFRNYRMRRRQHRSV